MLSTSYCITMSEVYLVIVLVARVCGKVASDEDEVRDESVNAINKYTRIIHDNVFATAITSEIVPHSKKVINLTYNEIDGNTTEHRNKTRADEIIDNNIGSGDGERKVFTIDNGTALVLSPLIEQGRIEEARIACEVDAQLFLGVKSYSGFLTVNKTYNSNLFFWYFPVENKAVNETPWIVWLQGGPGASSLTGLFDELGPFTVDDEGNLKHKQYSWLQNHSLVFIDNPIGSGFSFTEHEEGFVTDMTTYGKHLYTSLRQLIQLFPELRTAPLYVAGESYAGKYVPALGIEIHEHKLLGEEINLQGLIIGNAYVDPTMISQIIRPFYYFGLVEQEQIDMMRPLLDSFNRDMAANRSVEAKTKWIKLMTILLFVTHQKHAYNFLRDELNFGNYVRLLMKSEFKRALHVGDIEFSVVNVTTNTLLAPDFLSSSKSKFETLLDHYRVLAYCGQLDQMLPCVSTSEHYRTWKWNASGAFHNATRYPFFFNKKLAGYQKSGGGLTTAVVRGAGHMVPMDAPAPVRWLVTRWTHHLTLAMKLSLFETSIIKDLVNNSTQLHFL